MTRLKSEWILDIEDNIAECEKYLLEKTGRNFKNLTNDKKWPSEIISVAVVPITQGDGIIGSFSSSVAAIINAMGFNAFVTTKSDVSGILEAYLNNANVIFMADDDKFIAVNTKNGKIADNNEATARGYVGALEGYAKDLKGKSVLILGYGNVGKELLKTLLEKGAETTVMEKDKNKLNELSRLGIKTIISKDDIKNYKFIIDATNTGDWIEENILSKDAFIFSPGIPLSLDENALKQCEGRIVYDYLQIGVATMMRMVL